MVKPITPDEIQAKRNEKLERDITKINDELTANADKALSSFVEVPLLRNYIYLTELATRYDDEGWNVKAKEYKLVFDGRKK